MQSSMAASVWRKGERRWRGGRGLRDGLRLGSGLRFVMQSRFLDGAKQGRGSPPADCSLPWEYEDKFTFLGAFYCGEQSTEAWLCIYGEIHTIESGEAHSIWKNVASQILFLASEPNSQVDWSIFEGVIVDSIEAKEAISRDSFELVFRKMYDLPLHSEALPPMPEDGGYWSTLHSWVMPTPSFLEFMMFTRMFVNSLDSFYLNSSGANDCLLGSTKVEKKHCYCRILELLVNVWAYHSARKMVYLDPRTCILTEQHHVDLRRGFMWPKYFNFTLLKSMGEDLAEAVDDGYFPRDPWLLTGEVHWQGIYEREREERYRVKTDKKRKTKEKLYDRIEAGIQREVSRKMK